MEPKYNENSGQVTVVLIAGNNTQNCFTLNWVPKAVATAAHRVAPSLPDSGAAEISRLKKKKSPTFHGRRPQPGAQSAHVPVAVPDLGQRLLPPQLHERAQVLQRAAEFGLVVGLGTPPMFGPAERVVGHGCFLLRVSLQRGASPEHLVVGPSGRRSSLAGTLFLWRRNSISDGHDEGIPHSRCCCYFTNDSQGHSGN